MNKIFKVIWNRTTQSLVVTSELAKGAVKASCENNNQENKTSFGRIFKLSAIAIALTGAINYANAAYTEMVLQRLIVLQLVEMQAKKLMQ